MRDRLLRNWKLRLLSFVLAYFTWLWVNQFTRFEKVFDDVPIDFLLDDGWALRDKSTDVVEVAFRGSREDINRLKTSEMRVEINLKGSSFKENQVVELTPRNVRTTGGAAQPFEVRPRLIKLRLDQEDRKLLPVRATFSGRLPPGYEVEKWVAEPELVPIKGSRARLAEVDFLLTSPIELEGQLKSFEVRAPLVVPFAGAVMDQIERGRVLVKVSIISQLKQRDLPDIPVGVVVPPGPNAPSFTVEPNRVLVKVEGGIEAVQQLLPEDISVFVRPSSIVGTNRVPVRIHAPTGLTIIDIQPRMVKIVGHEVLPVQPAPVEPIPAPDVPVSPGETAPGNGVPGGATAIPAPEG